MKSDKAIEAFDQHLEDATRIASELLVVLVNRVGWSDDEIDWTKVEPMTEILSQLEQIQQTVEAATGNRRPPLPDLLTGSRATRSAWGLTQTLTCKNKMVTGELVETEPPVSQRWFSQPTSGDSR